MKYYYKISWADYDGSDHWTVISDEKLTRDELMAKYIGAYRLFLVHLTDKEKDDLWHLEYLEDKMKRFLKEQGLEVIEHGDVLYFEEWDFRTMEAKEGSNEEKLINGIKDLLPLMKCKTCGVEQLDRPTRRNFICGNHECKSHYEYFKRKEKE